MSATLDVVMVIAGVLGVFGGFGSGDGLALGLGAVSPLTAGVFAYVSAPVEIYQVAIVVVAGVVAYHLFS